MAGRRGGPRGWLHFTASAIPWIGKVHHDFVLPDLEAIVDKIQQLRTAKPLMAT